MRVEQQEAVTDTVAMAGRACGGRTCVPVTHEDVRGSGVRCAREKTLVRPGAALTRGWEVPEAATDRYRGPGEMYRAIWGPLESSDLLT